MKNKSFFLSIFIILILSFDVNAQWTDNGTYITTLDKVGISTSSIGITGTGVNTLVIGNGISSQGLVVNAGSANDGILAFADNGTLASRLIYSNFNGSLRYDKYGLGTFFKIDNTGNFGIGTSNPSVKLDISGSGTSTTVTRLSSGGHANYRQSRGSSSYDGGYLFYTGSTLDWRFQESANSSNLNIIDESLSTNVMTFQDNTGNIGIGNGNPSEALDVVGTIKSDYLFLNSINSNEGGELLLDGAPGYTSWSVDNFQGKFRLHHSGTAFFSVAENGNIGIGSTSPASKLDIKIGSSETVRMLDFTDGNYRVGSVEKLSSNDGVGLVLSGYTKTSVTEANPTLVLKGYTKDLAPNNEYDAAVTVRGYNVEDDTELQNIPIFKVLNAHSVAHLTVAASGNVGIGTSSPDSKLAVNGTIHTKEVKVDLIGWSDFVFEDDYDLPSLTELESFILKNKHLPDVPTEAEVLENGIMLGEMNAKLLQKIEELTLYLIDQNKMIENLQKEVSELKEEK